VDAVWCAAAAPAGAPACASQLHYCRRCACVPAALPRIPHPIASRTPPLHTHNPHPPAPRRGRQPRDGVAQRGEPLGAVLHPVLVRPPTRLIRTRLTGPLTGRLTAAARRDKAALYLPP
jgi:hypothetical protein